MHHRDAGAPAKLQNRGRREKVVQTVEGRQRRTQSILYIDLDRGWKKELGWGLVNLKNIIENRGTKGPLKLDTLIKKERRANGKIKGKR